MPVAIAPEETSTTSTPRACAAASASTSGSIWPTLGPEIELDPTFTTTRRASLTAARSDSGLTDPPPVDHLDIAVVRRIVTVVVGPQARLALCLELRPGGRLRIHALVIPLAPLGARRATVVVEPGVGAAGRGDELGRGGEGRLPVEDHAADL